VPSQIVTERARMLRFLTPTEAWRGRVAVSRRSWLRAPTCTSSKSFRPRSSGSWMGTSRRSKRTSRQRSIHLRQHSSRNSSWLRDDSRLPLRWLKRNRPPAPFAPAAPPTLPGADRDRLHPCCFVAKVCPRDQLEQCDDPHGSSNPAGTGGTRSALSGPVSKSQKASRISTFPVRSAPIRFAATSFVMGSRV
jgi:hypothetical protein